ncbi:aminopeptidase O isoform X2 [Strongylocentrotus purpuratus]|uniref:Peptidase M1 leukotriene A4 hydrolase/aminopeptidase C-terminal domain-containing protein n=1 Tax=Strongylocentrotus purpuratus TaxID=7668 RepID=A0A7M7PMB0_STRPU|nr:aminopeptidase O isoform X2 [Strongylocentrotus purpuratus]
MWNFDPGGMEATSNDLPLMSNIHDIRVKHYLLDLKVNLEDRVFTGRTTLFLEQPSSSKTRKTGLLPQASDPAHSSPSSKGVGGDKVTNEGNVSVAKDVRTARVHVGQEHLESSSFWRTKASSGAKPGEIGLPTEAYDSYDSSMPSRGAGDKVKVANEVSNNKDVFETASIYVYVNQEPMESTESPRAKATSEAKPFETRPKSEEVLSSFNKINEELASPCQKIEDDKPQMSKVASEQSSSHLSSLEFLDDKIPQDKDFVMILDCCDIDILAVEEIILNKGKLGVDTTSSGELLVENPDSPLENVGASSPYTNKKAEKDSTGQDGTAGKSLQENLSFKPNEYSTRRERFLSCQSMERNPLEFEVEPWCLKIWKRGVKNPADFPAAVCIRYRTRPCGRSLTWAVDQDGRPCVFTQGAWINNRSLFPCQEPPGAMATWQAIIHAPEEIMVVMSGDEEGRVLQKKDGMVSTLHFTDMLQPSSIVTLAIGGWRCYNVPVSQQPGDQWQPDKKHLFSLTECKVGIDRASSQSHCNHDEWPCRMGCYDQPIIPSRIIAPPSILDAAVKEFSSYLPKCLYAVFRLLGPHPFSRLDVLILPRCFASLGLASPSLIFLSQSLLSGDGSFLPRLAHEISHSWFGILIGARDWTEEWLSEGFATFMEDPVHAVAQNWTSKQYQDHSKLKALLRYQALKAELENTESELQIMRPMAEGPGTGTDVDDGGGGGGGDVGFVKNGLNPDKWFLQVHYLKGYFLLHHIAGRLSMEKTLQFINLYVTRCHGQLVLSKDIFQLLFDEYPEIKDQGITMETIYSDWLNKAGMPGDLSPDIYKQGNALISDVMAEVKRWKALDKFHQKSNKKKKKKKRKIMSSEFQDHPALKLTPDQLILLLEGVLDADTMATQTLEDLDTTYRLRQQNAEVRHRWCELVIKHKLTKANPDVRHFLMEDQAMGVYLYGELMASEDAVQQELARDCFKLVAMEIDRGCYRTVHEMVYGEPAERDDN